MDYHSFLIKEAVGGGHLPLWKLLKMLSVKPALPPIPGGKSLLYRADALKAPALAGAKGAPVNIKNAMSYKELKSIAESGTDSGDGRTAAAREIIRNLMNSRGENLLLGGIVGAGVGGGMLAQHVLKSSPPRDLQSLLRNIEKEPMKYEMIVHPLSKGVQTVPGPSIVEKLKRGFNRSRLKAGLTSAANKGYIFPAASILGLLGAGVVGNRIVGGKTERLLELSRNPEIPGDLRRMALAAADV